MADSRLVDLALRSAPALTDLLYAGDAGGTLDAALVIERLGGLLARNAVGGRLTLTSGTPITTADVTGATSVFFTPYSASPWCGLVTLYDGTRWKLYTFTELTLALGTLTSGLPYDVWLRDNASTLTLDVTAWSTATARATALGTQDGVLIKSGDATRRYLGTFNTTTTTTTEDSKVKRYLQNYYHRVQKPMLRTEGAANWVYSTATIRQANANVANQLAIVQGVAESPIDVRVQAAVGSSVAGSFVRVLIGEDSTTTPHASATAEYGCTQAATNNIEPIRCELSTVPPIGAHVYTWLELAAGSGTQTWQGSTAGYANQLRGLWWC